MPARRKTFSMDHPVIVLFVIIAVVAAMGLAAEVLKPLALSVLLAFALTPLARILERRGVPHVASVVITVVLSLSMLGGIGYVVAGQLNRLAGDVADPIRVENIRKKLSILNPEKKSNLTRASESVEQVTKDLQPAPNDATQPGTTESAVQQVRVVDQPEFRARLESAIGPYFEAMTVGSFVLILVLFLMVGREDLGNRIVALFGKRQVTVTTRTMNEVADRISRYLATNAFVNACFGLVIGLGLSFIGVPYAVLWGVLAALLRFVPYVGTVIAFGLPALYTVASFPGWREATLFLALFLTIELALNSFLEPIIYGKTTGVSALGLLVAAMFWTWLWGVWGLLLSTPMTVCLAVLGKYVPSLGFFATILGEEAELDADVRYYQKILALDQDGATEVVEEYLKAHTRLELFETVLIRALSKVETDFNRGDIDEREQAYAWRITDEVLDVLEGTPEISLKTTEAAKSPTNATGPTILCVPANDHSDALILRMLALVMKDTPAKIVIASEGETPMKLSSQVQEAEADYVFLSHLPPAGLTNARYLVRRLHTAVDKAKIVVGRWGDTRTSEETAQRLTSAGATGIVYSLTEARDFLLPVAPATQIAGGPSLQPALA